MPKKIESLPEDLAARLPEIRGEWLAVGLSTDPADRPAAEAGVDEAYEAAGLDPPKLKISRPTRPRRPARTHQRLKDRTMSDRDQMGRVVREAWVRWALTQPEPKPSWLVPYDELSEPDKEADRQIAEAVASDMNVRRIHLAEKKSRGELMPWEADEFNALQTAMFDMLDARWPRKPDGIDRLVAIERDLNGRVAD